MHSPHTETDLQGRKQVRLRLRHNLLLIPQRERGEQSHVLKDPVSLRYFRLDKRQHFLVGLMDGTRTLHDILEEYERHFRPDRLPLEDLEAFAAQLLASGLAQNDSPGAGRLLFKQSDKKRWQARTTWLLNFLCIRVPLFDPDQLLNRLRPVAGFLFTWKGFVPALAVILGAVGLVATHWGDFLARLPSYREVFSLGNLAYFWLALGLVKILHEFGHGISCKQYGGESHEMGILLLLFFPALYCDVSDGWKLPSKWRRMAVSAAGLYVELLVAALATFAWWASDAGTFVHHLCFGLMVVCSINTVLCNANPLMRLDGYFVLSDWLEVPNLGNLSSNCLLRGMLGWLGVPASPPPVPMSRRRQVMLASYAALSFVYRMAVLALSLYVLYAFLKPRRLAPVMLLLVAGAVAVLLVWPVFRLIRALHQHGGLRAMKASRIYLTLAALLLAGFVVVGVPFPLRVEGTALLQMEADQVDRVTVPNPGGFLGTLLVLDGQHVHAGEVLAALSNPKLEIALRVNEADQALRLEQQRAMVANLAGARERDAGMDPARVDFELQALRQQHRALKKEQAQLTLRAPRDGVVTSLPSREDVGKWLAGGAELCRVGNERALRAVLLLEPSDQVRVVPGSPAKVRVHGCAALTWSGVVSDVAQVEARAVPPQLSRHAGGEVATDQDPVSRQETPKSQHYLVSVRLDRTDRRIHPGALGRVQVTTGSQTLWWRLRRYLATNFNWGL